MIVKLYNKNKVTKKRSVNYHLRVAVIPCYLELCTKLTKRNINIQAAQRKNKDKGRNMSDIVNLKKKKLYIT